MRKPKVLIPEDDRDIGPWLFVTGVVMLVLAGGAVVVGLISERPTWFGFTVGVGLWGLIYVVVVLALSSDSR